MSDKTKRSFIILVSIFFILISGTAFSNGSNYPMESNETLIEERSCDNGQMEIFTLWNGQYYRKTLSNVDGRWTVIDSEEIKPMPTGLISDESNETSDKKLAGIVSAELKKNGLAASALPPRIDYSGSNDLPPIGKQYENSCVGWAVGYYLRTFQQARDIGWSVREGGRAVDSHVFSPSFIYNQINNGIDSGATLMDAAELLKNIGAATMDKFPYIPYNYYTKPSQDVINGAYPNRIREWRRLYGKDDTSDQEIIQRIKEYLNTGDLVVAGNNIGIGTYYPRFDQNGRSILTTESSTSYKHAFVVVGYDDTIISSDGIGAFILLSSWGEQWGNNGFSYISYKAFTTNAIEGYVFTDLPNAITEPLSLNLNNSATFEYKLSASCFYDFQVLNNDNILIYEDKNIKGNEGVNIYNWNGCDLAGAPVEDGTYTLSLITYINNRPNKPVLFKFEKSGKVETASSNIVSYEGIIQAVDIPIKFKNDGILSIKVKYNEDWYDIVTGQNVKSGDSQTFRIGRGNFDFNNKDLDNISIVIDVK